MTADKRRQGEPQYEEVIAAMRSRGPEKLGLMTSWGWYDDPKRLAFTLARYKFVSKMLAGSKRILEVGCGDGFGTRIVAQGAEHVMAVDFDQEFIDSAKSVMSDRYPITFAWHDMLAGPVAGQFDAMYSMDVIEHIEARDEHRFIQNMIAPLDIHGVCIVGSPSLESQAYASKFSKMGHVNCKEQPHLRALLATYFHNTFAFSMNDEVVHTGYSKMSHYNIIVACGKRS